MADKITLSDVTTFVNDTSATTVVNSNNEIIEAAFNNTLSLDGTAPNQMGANLDMDSFRIFNLPAPATSQEPLRLSDLESFIGGGTISTFPAGGTTGQVLAKNSNTSYDTVWENSVTSVGLSLPNDFTITGSPVTTTGTLTGTWVNTPTGTGSIVRTGSPNITSPFINTGINFNGAVSGSTEVIAGNAVASGILTLPNPAVSDTLVARTTTDTLTNKTMSGASNTFSAIPISSLGTETAYTILGNPTSSSATPTAFNPSTLTLKASPVPGDIIMIADSASSDALKYTTVGAISGGGTVTSIGSLTGVVGLGPNLSTSSNNIVTSFAPITNALSADVALSSTSTYFDGPSVAQGTSGTWFVSGTVTLLDSSVAAGISSKLWDGTTIISSCITSISTAGFYTTVNLCGFITTPAGNLRISCKDASSTSGKIIFNGSGNSKDSSITAIRIA